MLLLSTYQEFQSF